MSKHKDLEVDVARMRSMETTTVVIRAQGLMMTMKMMMVHDELLNRKTGG